MSQERAQQSSYEDALAATSPFTEPDLITYFEGTDASGKDTLADLMIERDNLVTSNVLCKAGGFLLQCTQGNFDEWRRNKICQETEGLEPALLLMATVRDLGMAHDPRQTGLPAIQASHHAIRGAAFQHAFDLDLRDLFEASTTMLPARCWPVALETSIPELQRRVEENPDSTDFDRMVLRQPEKIRAISDYIAYRCIDLGGYVLETTHREPEDLVLEVEEARSDVILFPCNVPRDDVLRTGGLILDELRSRRPYEVLAPMIDSVLEEFDGAR